MLNQNKDTDMICRFILSVGLILSFALPIAAADEPLPWKWDVTIYVRPGWSATWLRTVELQENDEIVISVTANKEGTYAGDFYWEKGSSDTAMDSMSSAT